MYGAYSTPSPYPLKQQITLPSPTLLRSVIQAPKVYMLGPYLRDVIYGRLSKHGPSNNARRLTYVTTWAHVTESWYTHMLLTCERQSMLRAGGRHQLDTNATHAHTYPVARWVNPVAGCRSIPLPGKVKAHIWTTWVIVQCYQRSVCFMHFGKIKSSGDWNNWKIRG